MQIINHSSSPPVLGPTRIVGGIVNRIARGSICKIRASLCQPTGIADRLRQSHEDALRFAGNAITADAGARCAPAWKGR
jgi:hypothetical protein